MTAIKVPVLEVNMSLYIMVCSNFQQKKIKKIASRFLKIYVTIFKKNCRWCDSIDQTKATLGHSTVA